MPHRKSADLSLCFGCGSHGARLQCLKRHSDRTSLCACVRVRMCVRMLARECKRVRANTHNCACAHEITCVSVCACMLACTCCAQKPRGNTHTHIHEHTPLLLRKLSQQIRLPPLMRSGHSTCQSYSKAHICETQMPAHIRKGPTVNIGKLVPAQP